MQLHPLTLPLLILIESARDIRTQIQGSEEEDSSDNDSPKNPNDWSGSRQRKTHPLELVIDSGAIRGEWLEQDGKPFMAFKSIPYAAPPVGALRFQPPVEPAQWRGVMNATQYPQSCVQRPEQHEDSELGAFFSIRRSEDCLFLNVFAPAEYGNWSYPVLVWLHGGGFQIGSSADYKQEPILRHFVSLGAVFITVNYRLGPMGFLSTGDTVLPGNMGLWDQLAALRWVQRNAHVFSGDKERVTIIGHGSGAAAASLLTVSPRAQGLFRSAILLSGTALTPGTVRTTAVNATWNLQELLHCRAFNSTELLDCVGKRHRSEIISGARRRVHYDDYQEWVPVVDGFDGVLPDKPENLFLSQPKKIPILLGTSRNESALRLLLFGRGGVNLSDINEESAYNLVKNLTSTYPGFENKNLITSGCNHEYVKTRVDPSGSATDLQTGIMDLYSEFWYHSPASKLASAFAAHTDVFLYSFDHVPLRFFPEDSEWKGAFHGSELSFLFDIPLRFLGERSDQNWEIDRRVTELFARLLVNFARAGEPTPEDDPGLEFNWTRYDPAQLNYLSLTDNPAMKVGYHWRGDAFWNTYAAILNGVDVGNEDYIGDLEKELANYQLATWSLLFCALFFFAVLVGLACYCTRKDPDEDDL